MPRALVAIDQIDRDRDILERARTFAIGAGTPLVVVALATPDEYEEVERTLDAIGQVEHTNYDEDAVLEGVSGEVEDAANQVLGSAVDHELRTVVAEAGEQAAAIVDIANQTGCDHVFLSGPRRSPTKKALFGDRTQRVILDFEGYVTVAMS
ncbi:UspA domain-containing protein [Haloferax prahovense DSM 18310]|uniref:UspA domain-containing protein n=1 Tax=Haloferax prahovense (strain DSM 18310 / JCM 13924 / TL6) TaxID=1227461 RepID=M0FYQ9_HALPT|nr:MULTISPECIES: universal stress protein [Haloferax]ELZ65196.1 UspA domain-containing protein [Haloferax prahovense DSM 18310]RDZ48425.1 universal stress protein [Haloferax sp. Atlit-19N]